MRIRCFLNGGSDCRKTSIVVKNGVEGRSPQQGLGAVAPHSAPARTPGVYAQRLCTMQSQPSIHSLSRGKGVFGKDAEIRTRQALHEAKPSECPKGDRDNKSEVYFKNRLFLQADPLFFKRRIFLFASLR